MSKEQTPAPAESAAKPEVYHIACEAAERRAGVPPELTAFRAKEGAKAREMKLRALWDSLPSREDHQGAAGLGAPPTKDAEGLLNSRNKPLGVFGGLGNIFVKKDDFTALSSSTPSGSVSRQISTSLGPLAKNGEEDLTAERAQVLRTLYNSELIARSRQAMLNQHSRQFGGVGLKEATSGGDAKGKGKEKLVDWQSFRTYLWEKEAELWEAFQELDRNKDGRLDVEEMKAELGKAGIDLSQPTLDEFIVFLSSPNSTASAKGVTWIEFRDKLLMLPSSPSVPEIYKFYQVRKKYLDGRGAARLTSDGDVSPSFPNAKPASTSTASEDKSPPSSDAVSSSTAPPKPEEHEEEEEEEEDAEDSNGLSVNVALKFLLAGGIAGAVSRTATAPFDRLKIFLITDSTNPKKSDVPLIIGNRLTQGFDNMRRAVLRLYLNGGGVRAFWVGNGLNVIKIMPESAIKFFSYESSKRFLARYWDKVDDPGSISGSSRFLSGGVGGLTSQFAIYPLETLKTQHMTTAGSDHSRKVLYATATAMWKNGGVRRYYRGLNLALIGVFPYAAIDMSTYEQLKINYCAHYGKDEPSTVASLAFGAISGGVGASIVYPINLLRTKLQASGSTGHPQIYNGFLDVAQQTLSKEGWKGMYRGLGVSLVKVVPAVAISYVVYDHSKRVMNI